MTYSAIILLKSKTDFIFDNPHVVIKNVLCQKDFQKFGLLHCGYYTIPPWSERLGVMR